MGYQSGLFLSTQLVSVSGGGR